VNTGRGVDSIRCIGDKLTIIQEEPQAPRAAGIGRVTETAARPALRQHSPWARGALEEEPSHFGMALGSLRDDGLLFLPPPVQGLR
jgi:hypothetical protein